MSAAATNILVIKLGALGDMVQALGPFAAIRRHHAGARIVLLTTAPFADFARASGCFDEVWIDEKPRWTEPGAWLELRRKLRGGDFGRVYDLQTSDRSSSYFRMFWPGPVPEWSGIARGCSHPHANPKRDSMHTLERQAEQLRMAGIDRVEAPSFDWVQADTARFGLPERYALLVPGGAAHRPEKRWSAERFGELAGWLVRNGMTPVLLGTRAEAGALERIAEVCPEAVSLAGRTDFLDIAALGRDAAAAVGNDTGPMHLIAAAGAPSVVLFSEASDPSLCAPRGLRVAILRRPSLTDLRTAEVETTLGAVWEEPGVS